VLTRKLECIFSGGGRYLGSFITRSIQRRIRQYTALSNPETCLELARRLVICRGQGQRKFLIVDSEEDSSSEGFEAGDRSDANPSNSSPSRIAVGTGRTCALYFGALPFLISEEVASELHFSVQ